MAILFATIGFGLSGGVQASANVANAGDESGSSTGFGSNTAGQPESLKPEVKGSGQDNLYSTVNGGLPKVDNPGQYLYVQGCSTCHGLKGEGSQLTDKVAAPPLIGVGDAAVDFYVSTGRMPINQPKVQAPRKKPSYSRAQIDELIKYVRTLTPASVTPGPAIPVVNPAAGDLVEGNFLYANNCAQCHNSQGSGGALGSNYNAPNLYDATAVETAEAIRFGPNAMPVFGPETFNQDQLNSLVKYVQTLKNDHDYGGFGTGGLGPVAEGFIAWIVGLGALLAITRWIGTRI